MAAFLHSQSALLGWDFAQLCPQGGERERLCSAKTSKGQQGSQEEARNRVRWEMVHKALGVWSSAGFVQLLQELRGQTVMPSESLCSSGL